MKISNISNFKYNPHFCAAKAKTSGLSQNASKIVQSQENSKEPVCHAPFYDKEIHEYIRAHYLESIGIYDENCEKTIKLFEKMKDEKTLSNSNFIENFAKTNDNNGYHGSAVFSARGRKNIRNLINLGVKRIIDLRAEGTYESCSKICKAANLEYIKFPIPWGEEWKQSDIESVIKLIEELRKGDYYIGCALGSHRTDAALSVAYCLDANAKQPPRLISGTSPAKMRKIMEKIFYTINEVCYTDSKKEFRLSNDYAKRLGWKNLEHLMETLPKRKAAIKQLNDTILKSR